VTGSAVFTQTSTGVTLGIALNNCVDGKSYPIHIHMGTSCMDPAAPAGHWDPPRGEGIPDVKCMGSTASENYSRLNSDTKPWSIGDMKDSDMVGHAMVLHDPDDNTKRVACGKIIAQ
jgi:Cu/Zn superoxide dismutase